MSGVLRTCWAPLIPGVDAYYLGGRKAHNSYRQCIPWLARLQAGMALTACYHHVKWTFGSKSAAHAGVGVRCWCMPELSHPMRRCTTLIGDGTQKMQTHIESAVLELDNGERINIIPSFQADKKGATSAATTIVQADLCQEAYGLLLQEVEKKHPTL